jgi:amidophosphoribosyltransferase
MAGIFGIVAQDDVPVEKVNSDAKWGTFYLQHRSQKYCGFASTNGDKLHADSHKGLLRQQFPPDMMTQFHGHAMIGSVSSTREPISFLTRNGKGAVLTFDGNIINSTALRDKLGQSAGYDGCHDPNDVPDATLMGRVLDSTDTIEKGFEALFNEVQGDFAFTMLTQEGVYAGRGFGRKPLILGKKDGAYAVSSESNSFENTGFSIIQDVQPGELVLLNKDGINRVAKMPIDKPKFGTFEWIYTAHPASVIDGRSVAEARLAIGSQLWQRYGHNFNITENCLCSGIPNSGRWHGLGFSKASGIPYEEVYVRYDYADRSYTQDTHDAQQEEAYYKLIPVRSVIKGNKVFVLDDSIVRGTQTKRQATRLRDAGALEVHALIACPPLRDACGYGKTTKKSTDCIANQMSLDDIRKTRNLDTLSYATEEDLSIAIGKPLEQLCLECWCPPKDTQSSCCR